MMHHKFNYICRASRAVNRISEATASRVVQIMVKNRQAENRDADKTYD